MTLDEAIKHAEEVAIDKADLACTLWDSKEKIRCEECAEEHRQLAEWLKELKQHREAWQKVREEIGKEIKCADVFLTYGEYKFGFNYGLGLALGVIDNALEEIEKGEQ